MRIRVIAGSMALAVSLGTAVLLFLNGAVVPVNAQQIETVVVERTDLNTSIETSGTIAPAQSMTLVFGTSGIVSAVNVEVGDTVAAGDILAQIDTSDLEYQIRLKEQSLIVQQTSYDDLVAPPTDEQIAQAQASLTSAQSQLVQAQNSLNSAPNNTTINCSNVNERQSTLEDARADWDDYVREGYEMDAAFQPNAESTAGTALEDSQRAYDVAVAQCNNTTPVNQYELQVASAQASVDQAQAALDSLLAGATTEEIAAAEARLEQSRLELENARAALEDAQIIATFSGVISEVGIQIGEAVTSNSAAVAMVDISSLHVDVDVDEVDIPLIAVGQPALIAPAALDGVTIDGSVSRIAPSGTSANGVVTFNVRVDLPQTGRYPIYVGMTTDVEIVTGSETGVLVVPTEAIQRSGTTEYVEILNADGTTAQVNITTGATIEGQTVITGELDEGVSVVLPVEDVSANSGFNGPFGG